MCGAIEQPDVFCRDWEIAFYMESMLMGVQEDAEERATRLEREAEDAIAGRFCLEDGIRLASEALAIRQAFQGEEHRDLIWPLSLWIEALRCLPGARNAMEAARLGERRLALRKVALAGAPDELGFSVRELMDLYTFKNEPLDPRRVEELAGNWPGGRTGQDRRVNACQTRF